MTSQWIDFHPLGRSFQKGKQALGLLKEFLYIGYKTGPISQAPQTTQPVKFT